MQDRGCGCGEEEECPRTARLTLDSLSSVKGEVQGWETVGKSDQGALGLPELACRERWSLSRTSDGPSKTPGKFAQQAAGGAHIMIQEAWGAGNMGEAEARAAMLTLGLALDGLQQPSEKDGTISILQLRGQQ